MQDTLSKVQEMVSRGDYESAIAQTLDCTIEEAECLIDDIMYEQTCDLIQEEVQ